MELSMILVIVFIAGCCGGIVNSLITGGFAIPKLEPETNVWRPGWLGNIVIGGVAAVVFWAYMGHLPMPF